MSLCPSRLVHKMFGVDVEVFDDGDKESLFVLSSDFETYSGGILMLQIMQTPNIKRCTRLSNCLVVCSSAVASGGMSTGCMLWRESGSSRNVFDASIFDLLNDIFRQLVNDSVSGNVTDTNCT